MWFAPHNKPVSPRGDLILVTWRCGGQGPHSFRIGDSDSTGSISSLYSRPHAHKLADEVLQQLPVVEASFVLNKIITDTGEGDEVDPEGVEASLLEAGREQGGGDIGVEGVDCCVVTVGTADGTGSRGARGIGPPCEEGIESALVGDEGPKDIVLDKMEEVVG